MENDDNFGNTLFLKFFFHSDFPRSEEQDKKNIMEFFSGTWFTFSPGVRSRQFDTQSQSALGIEFHTLTMNTWNAHKFDTLEAS